MRTIIQSRVLTRWLITILSLVGPSISSGGALQIQCVLVENAKISRHELAKEGDFGRANYGHQIAAGTRNVVAIRVYENGGGAPDTQIFKKATLEINLPTNSSSGKEVNLDVLRSHYAEGASGEAADGAYSWAKNPFHKVLIRSDGGGQHVKLKASVVAKNESFFAKGRKEKIEVDFECPLTRRTVTELTPWVGKVGTTWGSFYMKE